MIRFVIILMSSKFVQYLLVTCYIVVFDRISFVVDERISYLERVHSSNVSSFLLLETFLLWLL